MNTLITDAPAIYWVHLFNVIWTDANLFNGHQTGNDVHVDVQPLTTRFLKGTVSNTHMGPSTVNKRLNKMVRVSCDEQVMSRMFMMSILTQ